MATGNILAEGNIDKVKILAVSVNLPSISAATTGQATVTVPGVQVGDFVALSVPVSTFNQGVGIVDCYVSAADTVVVRGMNATAGAIDVPAITCLLFVARPDATLTAF